MEAIAGRRPRIFTHALLGEREKLQHAQPQRLYIVAQIRGLDQGEEYGDFHGVGHAGQLARVGTRGNGGGGYARDEAVRAMFGWIERVPEIICSRVEIPIDVREGSSDRGVMTIKDMRVPFGLRALFWAVLAIHIAALVGYGPTDWFDVWYQRITWCVGLMVATVMITGDWLARRCAEPVALAVVD